MSDDKSKKQPQDASKVNVQEQYEVEYWTKKFGVTPDQLKAAVSRIGTSAAKVEQDLMRIVPKKDWFDLSHLMIFHGRAICLARKPLCEECALAKLCPSAFVRPA